MIAAVKGCSAVLAALLFWAPRHTWAADDLSGAARELARKTASFAGRGGPVSVTWRNLSSLGPVEAAQARAAFETALREAGVHPADTGATVEARVAISENQLQYLLVEEARKGDERQVWIAAWRRAATGGGSGVSLEKKLLWEQADPILDAVLNGSDLLILSPGGVLLRDEHGSRAAAIRPIRPLPRDPRGHLRITGSGFKANLPGVACTGTFDQATAIDCRPSDEPWEFDAGGRTLAANFAASRNFFDGRVVTPEGAYKSIAPFYSVAAVEQQGRPLWLFAMIDGRTLLLDGALEQAGIVGPWGSDLAATQARCGGGTQVLTTKPGDAREPDAIQAWAIVNGAPRALTPPMDLPGPVTALWSLGAADVVAVVKDLESGRYLAYLITVVCGA